MTRQGRGQMKARVWLLVDAKKEEEADSKRGGRFGER
jgi:hypothetical protein